MTQKMINLWTEMLDEPVVDRTTLQIAKRVQEISPWLGEFILLDNGFLKKGQDQNLITTKTYFRVIDGADYSVLFDTTALPRAHYKFVDKKLQIVRYELPIHENSSTSHPIYLNCPLLSPSGLYNKAGFRNKGVPGLSNIISTSRKIIFLEDLLKKGSSETIEKIHAIDETEPYKRLELLEKFYEKNIYEYTPAIASLHFKF